MGEISRREFLGAAAGGVLLTRELAARPLAVAEEAGWPKLPAVKIHVVYVGTGGAWPTPTFDAPAEVRKFKDYLAGVETRLGDVKFVGGELIPNTVPAATEVAAKLKDADAVLVVHLSFGSGEPLLKLVEAGLPSAIFSQPFSKLNDLGLVGACEGDMDSTLTMLLFAYAVGVPGFISDPRSRVSNTDHHRGGERKEHGPQLGRRGPGR